MDRLTDNLGFYIDPLDPLLAGRLIWLREQGVRYLGFDGMGRDDPDTYGQIRSAIEAADLDLLVIHGEPPLVAPDGQDDALRAAHVRVLDRAVALGARVIVLHWRLLGEVEANLQDHDRRATELLRMLSDRAGEAGVAIAVENVPWQYPHGWRIDDLLAFLSRAGLPNVRMCLDSGHAHLCGVDVAQAIEQAGQWLLTTHLHDNLGRCEVTDAVAAVDRHLVPGLGTINWPALIVALDRIGYAQPVMFEGVRTIPHGNGPDFELAVDLTLRNWAQFHKIARTLQQPIAR